MEEIVWRPTRPPIVRALDHTLAFFLIDAVVLGGLGLVLPCLAPAANQERHRPDFLATPGATLAILRVINVGLLLAPTLVMARFEGRSVWSYGLAGRMDGPEGTLARLAVQLALLAAMIVMVKRRAGASRLLNGAGAEIVEMQRRYRFNRGIRGYASSR